MDKVCKIFDVDFNHFLSEDAVSFSFEKIEKTKSENIDCEIDIINNNYQYGILESMLKRIELLEKSISSK